MTKLPNVYKNDIKRRISNNKQMCYVEELNDNDFQSSEVRSTLKKVYAGLGKDYNTNVIIQTKDNTYDTTLISKDNKQIITEENKVININDIKNIKIKK